MIKKRFLSILALLCLTLSGAWAQSNLVAVPDPSSFYEPTQIANGSFESWPTMAGSRLNRIPNGTNQGWNTTENGYQCFEWVSNVKPWHNPNLNPIGNRCVEMNADNAATLYQDLYTNGGDVIRWSLAHAVRSIVCGPDEQYMRVEVGAPLYNGDNIVYPTGVNFDINTNINPDTKATYHYNGIDNPTGHTYGFNGQNLENLKLTKEQAYQWYYTSGVYIIPESQPVTRFAFVSEDNSSCGNLLDDISFSTLVGDLSATYGDNNSVVIKGYWGETDTSKKLIININGTPNEVDMTSVSGQNFVITTTYGNKPTEVTIYHQDYASAARTVSVNNPISVSAANVEVEYDGNAHTISPVVTDPESGYTLKYGTTCGGCSLDELTYTVAGTYRIYYSVSAPGYTTYNGKATLRITKPAFPIIPVTATDLGSITGDYTAQDGEILTGTLGANVKISIADGATVTLLDANINGDKTWMADDQNTAHNGLTCLGNATITIEGTNSVCGFNYYDVYGNCGIYVPSGKTLTINGTGSLKAEASRGYATGIGASRKMNGGNIVIQSGKITAIGSSNGAGIGATNNGDCGNITISGGIVTAVGGYNGAGIGGGHRSGSGAQGNCGNILISGCVVSATSGTGAAAIGGGMGQAKSSGYWNKCGTVTITSDVLKVYAAQGGGKGSPNTIGAGKYNSCGTVTVNGIKGGITADPYTYGSKEDWEIVVDYINAIGTVDYTQECKDKIDRARELYDALTDAQKDLVSNYQTLVDAEPAIVALADAGEPEEPEIVNPVQIDGLYYNLDAVNMTAEVTYQEMSETNYSSLTAVDIPESVEYNSVTYSVTSIGMGAFFGCQGLTSVTIPGSVTSIGFGAFQSCEGLTSITIPSSVEYIGGYAFAYCEGLTSVTIPGSATSIGDDAFAGTAEGLKIYVPAASVDDYKAAWAAYADKITAAPTVTMKEGTEDAANWTITPPEAKTTGVAAGTEVTATYSGTRHVKSVKAVKKVAAPTSLTITDGNEFSTSLDIAGCTTWDEVIAKNSDKIKKVDEGYITDSTGQYGLLKGKNTAVNADDLFDPNATDYKWVEGN